MMSNLDAAVYQDFDNDIILVKGYIRWKSGSLTMIEHIVHPKDKDKAERILQKIKSALTVFINEMEPEDSIKERKPITILPPRLTPPL